MMPKMWSLTLLWAATSHSGHQFIGRFLPCYANMRYVDHFSSLLQCLAVPNTPLLLTKNWFQTSNAPKELSATELPLYPCSVQIGVLGQAESGKKTLLRALDILPPDHNFQMSPTNEAVHSASFSRNCAGSTPLPFVTAPPPLSQQLSPWLLRPVWKDEVDLEAEPTWNHSNLTTHHFRPTLGVSDPGLTVELYSTAYESDEWKFVAPWLCACSDVIVFVLDPATSPSLRTESHLIQTLDAIIACKKPVLFALNASALKCKSNEVQQLSQSIRQRYGPSALISAFDFKNDIQNTEKFKISLLRSILSFLDAKRRRLELRTSRAAVNADGRAMLGNYTSKVDDVILRSVDSLMSHMTSTEEHQRVLVGHGTNEELRTRLGAYLQMRLFGHILSALTLCTMYWMTELDSFLKRDEMGDTLIEIDSSSFSPLIGPLYSWIHKINETKPSSIAVVGAVGTASGALVAGAALALSWTLPAVIVAATTATIMGASAGYATLSPSSTVLSLPMTKSKAAPTEEAIRDSVLGELATRFCNLESTQYIKLRTEALLLLRAVVMNAQYSATPQTHEWANLATIDESYLDSPALIERASLSDSSTLHTQDTTSQE